MHQDVLNYWVSICCRHVVTCNILKIDNYEKLSKISPQIIDIILKSMFTKAAKLSIFVGTVLFFPPFPFPMCEK